VRPVWRVCPAAGCKTNFRICIEVTVATAHPTKNLVEFQHKPARYRYTSNRSRVCFRFTWNRLQTDETIINRKFHVATEIGSSFFGFQQFTGQLQSCKMIIYDYLSSAWNFRSIEYHHTIFEFWDFGRIMAMEHWTKSQNRDSRVFSSSPWNFWSIEHNQVLYRLYWNRYVVRLSVRYFSAGIAPRELKFCL
jgi:hypothetical protein